MTRNTSECLAKLIIAMSGEPESIDAVNDIVDACRDAYIRGTVEGYSKGREKGREEERERYARQEKADATRRDVDGRDTDRPISEPWKD